MTDSSFDDGHLRLEMRQYLHIEGHRRLDHSWEEIWIPTPFTRKAFIDLQDCMEAAPSTKPRGLIITGEADTGKSRLMKAFRDKNKPTTDSKSEFAKFPAILILSPDKPDKTAVFTKILKELGQPIIYNAGEENLRRHTINMIRGCEVGTVMIDEFHDISARTFNEHVFRFPLRHETVSRRSMDG